MYQTTLPVVGAEFRDREEQLARVQVKRSALPLHFPAAAWKRMEAEARRLGWLWIVAAASPDGIVTFLDPARGRRRKGVGLSASATIVNLLAWVDDASTPRRR